MLIKCILLMAESANQPQISVSASQRGFGLGFGDEHQIVVYLNGPKTGALLSDEKCALIGQWVGGQDTCNITDHISAEDLTPAVHNRILHADTIELVRVLPKVIEKMSGDERDMFFVQQVDKIPEHIWEEIAKARPQLLEKGFDQKNPKAYFEKLLSNGNGAQISSNKDDIEFNGVSMEIVSFLLPMMFDAQEKTQQIKSTQILTNALNAAGEDKNFFAPLSDANINRLVISDPIIGMCNDGRNNGRTLMITSTEGQKISFQGNKFTSSNIHFHPLQNVNPDDPIKNTKGEVDSKAEFVCYRDSAHEAYCREHPEEDPNLNVVGQLHTIYTCEGKRAILLGASVVLGEHNEEFGKYIDFLKERKNGQQLEIIQNTSDINEVAEKAVTMKDIQFNPLACYNGRFDVDGIPEAPFTSLHLGGLKVEDINNPELKDGKSHIFHRGVRVAHLPEPITISPEQLKDLRELQPTLMSIDQETCVQPVGRFQDIKGRLQEKTKTAAEPITTIIGVVPSRVGPSSHISL